MSAAGSDKMLCRLLSFSVVCWFLALSAAQSTNDRGIVLTMWPDNVETGAKIRTVNSMLGYEEMRGLPSGLLFTTRKIDFLSIDVDFGANRVYLYDSYLRSIVIGVNYNSSMDLDGGLKFSYMHRGVGGGKSHLAVNWETHNVFWTDPVLKWIMVAPGIPDLVKKDYYRVVVHKDLQEPTAIAVDPENGHLYFSDIGDHPTIERSTLRGTDRKRLISSGLFYPRSLAWDRWDQRLYWVDSERMTVSWTDSEGSKRHFLRRIEKSIFFDVAVFRDALYVSDVDPTGGLFVLNKTTGNGLRVKVDWGTETIQAIGVYHTARQPVGTDYCASLNCSHFCIGLGNNNAECTCTEAYKLADDNSTCVEDTGNFPRAIVIATKTSICLQDIRALANFYYDPVCVYYPFGVPTTSAPSTTTPQPATTTTTSPTSEITRSATTVSTSRVPTTTAPTTVTTTAPTTVTTTKSRETNVTSDILFLDLDMGNRMIYFATNSSLHSIPVEIDDSNNLRERQLVATNGVVSGLVYDWFDNNLYWSESDRGNILLYAIDEFTVETVIANLDSPKALILLPHARQLMWIAGRSDTNSGFKIQRASVDGSGLVTVVGSANLTNPLALTRDPQLPRVLWVDDAMIWSCDYDGNNLKTLYSVTDSTYLLTMKPDVILWTDIFRGSPYLNTDNIKTSTMITGGTLGSLAVTDVKIFDTALQPPSPYHCRFDLHGCDQICVTVSSSRTGQLERECQCQFGFRLDPQTKTKCLSSPVYKNFILVSDTTVGQIFQVAIGSGDVQALNKPNDGDPLAIMYDATTQEVIYGTESDRFIKAMSLDGTKIRQLGEISGDKTYPYRFAKDETTGNLYYTTRGGKSYLAVRTPDNVHILLANKTSVLYSDIVVHPKRGLMFWTERGEKTEPLVMRADMNGKNMTTILDKTYVIWPDGLAIDYTGDKLYIADEYLDTIARCNFDGSGYEEVYSDHNAYIIDVAIAGSHFYYSSHNRMYVEEVSMSNTTVSRKVFDTPELGRLEAIAVVTDDTVMQPRNPDCADKNGKGNCSHICFPTTAGRTCACPPGQSLKADGIACSGVFQCEDVYLDNAAAVEPCTRYENAVCGLQCLPGFYKATVATQLKCTATGWDLQGQSLCEVLRCPEIPPNVGNLKLSTGCDRSAGSVCDFKCAPGYTKLIDLLKCDIDGTWTVDPATVCEENMCPTYFPNGEVDPATCSPAAKPTYKNTCDVKCDRNYKSTVDTLTCQADGDWDIDTINVCTEILCPNTQGNAIISGYCKYLVGETCSYTCQPGYQQKAGSEAVCLISGEWHLDDCTPTMCPMDIPHGTMVQPCQGAIGATCSFQCQSPYQPTTQSPLTCGANGLWLQADTACREIMCGDNVPHTIFGRDCTFQVGTTCSYSCQKGFSRSGSTRAVCSTSGKWDMTECTEILCPAKVNNVKLGSGCSRKVDTTCDISCEGDFKMNKMVAGKLNCLPSGQWREATTEICSGIPQKQKESKPGPIIGGVLAAVLIIVVIVVVLIIYFRRRRQQSDQAQEYPRAKYDGGPNIAIENPGYITAGAAAGKEVDDIEQPAVAPHSHYMTMKEANSGPAVLPHVDEDADHYMTMRDNETISIPDQEMVDAEDVVLTQDSWLREQARRGHKLENSDA